MIGVEKWLHWFCFQSFEVLVAGLERQLIFLQQSHYTIFVAQPIVPSTMNLPLALSHTMCSRGHTVPSSSFRSKHQLKAHCIRSKSGCMILVSTVRSPCRRTSFLKSTLSRYSYQARRLCFRSFDSCVTVNKALHVNYDQYKEEKEYVFHVSIRFLHTRKLSFQGSHTGALSLPTGIMRDSICSDNPTCLHGDDDQDDYSDGECQAEESDPTGRYIRYKEVLGRGAFKTVYRGFDEVHGIEVAWNQIKLQEILRSPQDLEQLCSEVHLLKTLKHRNIIKFHHSWVDTKANRINFITELFTSGTLRQYRKRHKHVDLKAVKNWCRQILRGLLYLHSHDPPIIHRDLKCDNIFINGNHGEVKIGDLGLAAILCQAHAAHSVIGTPEFMAPELYEEEYTELVDIYSFGMCLLEMVTSEYPYSECDNAAQIYKRVSSGIKPAALERLKDKELRQFVEKCIDTASKRLPAREVLMDPFLQYDKDTDPPECPPHPVLSRNASKSDDMEEFGALLQSISMKSSAKADSPAPVSLNLLVGDFAEALPKNSLRRLESSDLKHEKMYRNVDLKVKVKRRENEIVYLRLRISAEGNVRVIHFPFDVEADTAMCVASEMVEELDLADQDVTRIAEMIDAAVLVMVPEWRPGVAIEERLDGEESSGKEPLQLPSSRLRGSNVSTLSSDSSLAETPGQVLHSWHDHFGGCTTNSVHSGSNVHGRFEEVLYQLRPGFENHEEHPCNATTRSSEDTGDDWEHTSSSDSSPVCPASDDIAPIDGADPTCIDKQLESVCRSRNLYSGVMDAWALFQHDFGSDPNSELLMQEVKNLTIKFQQELKELQFKHQKALLELRAQWHGKRSSSDGSGMQGLSSMIDGGKEQRRNLQSNGCWESEAKEKENSTRLSFKELASLFATARPPDDLNCPEASLREPSSPMASVNT
ncbi:hypothetical protein GOP47_0015478 [Adiantum capillus-veneris]|uniref:non-specific serine/threonine protein kinase n=1 Tax=Adiantum capillus-veneris TaxID=13818 RepID=A0A9D4UKI4_ADICA|nr:hypothetical protein GOP47_0015478 [Adiantum capillus-veneris]